MDRTVRGVLTSADCTHVRAASRLTRHGINWTSRMALDGGYLGVSADSASRANAISPRSNGRPTSGKRTSQATSLARGRRACGFLFLHPDHLGGAPVRQLVVEPIR